MMTAEEYLAQELSRLKLYNRVIKDIEAVVAELMEEYHALKLGQMEIKISGKDLIKIIDNQKYRKR